MLEHGADPNLAPSDPGSVLDMAAEIGTVAAVDLLLQHGAKLENSTPLHNAASMGPHGAARLSRVLPSEYLAIVGDRIPMMKYLLEHGVDRRRVHIIVLAPLYIMPSLKAFSPPLGW
jgi:ankyrin repeat protein